MGMLLILVAPIIVDAQPMSGAGPNECCQIKRGFTWTNPEGISVSMYKGDWVGKNNGICFKEDGTSASLNYNKSDWALACLVNSIYSITDWIFYIIIVISVIFIIIGGFIILTARGNPEEADKGKNWIVYAVIGIVVAIFARIIPAIVKFVI